MELFVKQSLRKPFENAPIERIRIVMYYLDGTVHDFDGKIDDLKNGDFTFTESEINETTKISKYIYYKNINGTDFVYCKAMKLIKLPNIDKKQPTIHSYTIDADGIFGTTDSYYNGKQYRQIVYTKGQITKIINRSLEFTNRFLIRTRIRYDGIHVFDYIQRFEIEDDNSIKNISNELSEPKIS